MDRPPKHIEKAVQAAGVLLSEHDGQRVDRMRLLKMLYIADRKSIEATGYPMIGPKYVAMKNGPLHSEIYDLIRQSSSLAVYWSKYFKNDGYQVVREFDPGIGRLSRKDVHILREVLREYHGIDTFELSELTHGFPEWSDHFDPDRDRKTSVTIPAKRLYEAVGVGEEAEGYLKELEDARNADRLMDA